MSRSRPTLLLPMVFPDPELHPLPDTVVDGFAGFEIHLLGYWEVPEGESAEEVRAAHETEAEAVLYEAAARFSRAGAPTDIHLTFGGADGGFDSVRDRIAAETHVDGVFVHNPISTLGRVLVPLRDDRRRDQISAVVGALDAETLITVELYHAVTEDGDVEAGREMLADVREQLLERGFPELEVETTVETTDDPGGAIAARARGTDLVVIGETEQLDAEDRIFGPTYERIADRSETPILVVRGE